MNSLFVLCGIGVLSLLAEIANVRKGLTFIVVAGLIASIVLLIPGWGLDASFYNDMVVMNKFTIAFSALIIGSGILWIGTAKSFFSEDAYKTDRSALIVFAIIGGVLMVSFNNFAILFLGIEILSICLYVLTGSIKNNLFSNEASFKYFLMGSFATGFFLFGVALVYGATGTFDVTRVAEVISAKSTTLPAFLYVGIILIMVGMAFKMSAAPFHFWAPDVYEGAPTYITAFMATVVKIASVGAFLKVFPVAFGSVSSAWMTIIQVIMVVTLVMGNLSAVYQTGVKRILAYSSVGHVGYILLAVIATPTPSSIVFYYLISYSVGSLAAFAVVNFVEAKGSLVSLDHFQGLFRRNSFAALVMTVALLSLAGIPPLAGFFAKYLVFAAAVENGFIGFVIFAVVTSLIGVYYYFKIIRAMFADPSGAIQPLALSFPVRLLFSLLIILNLALAIFPDLVISLL
jgi:NADH-quinone oxidoreductase subunit N